LALQQSSPVARDISRSVAEGYRTQQPALKTLHVSFVANSIVGSVTSGGAKQ
jgi:hypothetical protein